MSELRDIVGIVVGFILGLAVGIKLYVCPKCRREVKDERPETPAQF